MIGSNVFSVGGVGGVGGVLLFTVVGTVVGSLPVSVCVTVIVSPAFGALSAGTGTSQVPSSLTVVLPISSPFLSFTTISAPGSPLPVILSSPSVTSLTVGVADLLVLSV